MSLVTLLSRVLGYLRDLLQAALLGAADSSDAFIVAFRIPNLLRRLLGEGALTAAFVPVLAATRQRRGEAAMWRFAAQMFWVLGGVLLVLSALGVLLAPLLVRALALGFGGIEGKLELTAGLTRLMFPYILFIALAALAMAVLNARGSFAVPAFTPVLLNLSIIGAALLAARQAAQPAWWFAVGVLVGGALQFLFQVPFLWRAGLRFGRPTWPPEPEVARVGRLMLPGLFGVGVTQLNLIVDSQVASFLGTGRVSWLYYAIRVEELVLGVFVVSLSTVILPTLARHAAQGEDELLRAAVARGLRFVGLATLPSMAGLWLLREPIIATLFERGSFSAVDTRGTALALACYGVGMLPNGFVKILAPAFYARLDTATPVKIGAAAFALHIPMCIGLAALLGHAGIALSTSLAALANATGLFFVLRRREGSGWTRSLAGSFGRLVAATAIMSLVLAAVLEWLPAPVDPDPIGRAVRLFGMLALGAAVFCVAALALGSREILEIGTGLRGRGESRRPKGR